MASKIPAYILARKHAYAKAFRDADINNVADHLRDCSELELLLCCQNCGGSQYVVYHCQNRVCPICSFHMATDRAKFVESLMGHMEFPKMVTLTIPLRREGPRETIKYLRKCFQKLRDRKVFAKVKGGAYSIEVKVKKGHFHIHMHIILDAPFIHYTQIYKAWADITGTPGVQVDIRAAKTEKQRAYIVKYTQKAAELHADGSDVVAWYKAVKGSRLFGTFGAWFNVKIEELLDSTEEKPEKPPCPHCGEVGFQFFARDGFFVFGKAWDDVKGYYLTKGVPESRPLDKPIPPPSQLDAFEQMLADSQSLESPRPEVG